MQNNIHHEVICFDEKEIFQNEYFTAVCVLPIVAISDGQRQNTTHKSHLDLHAP